MKDIKIENITWSGRIVRVAVGMALVYSVFLQEGTLGAAAYLPLIAIYPLISATLGWDPIAQFLGTRKRSSGRRITGRAAHAAG